MKSKVVLIAFLLMLYIAPMIFISSYGSVAIPAEQNMTKDFVISSDWYDEDWHYRKNVIMYSGLGGLEANYTVKVVVAYDSDMQADFADIRFTDDDNVTLLDYWLETYTASTTATFWVEVTDSQEWGTYFMIQMYYGNSEVSTTSNGEDTFLVFEDWSSESLRSAVWDIVSGDGGITYSAVDANHGKVAKVEGDAAGNYKLTTDYDTSAPIAIMFRSNIEEAGTGNFARQGSGYDGAFGFALVNTQSTGEEFYVYDDDGNEDSQAMTLAYFDTWVTFQITRDGTNTKLYADTVLIETASWDPDAVGTNPVASIMVEDSEDDLYSDWVAVRKFVTGETEVDSWGEEENNFPPPKWNEVGKAELFFTVPIDETGLDILLIFLGLIMIPLSTLYLVKGGRSEMSSDKLFYGLIAFAIGWALFLGGIT